MSQEKMLSLRMGFHEWLDTHWSLPLTSNKKQFTPSRFWGHSFWIKSVRGKKKKWHVRAGSTVLRYAARKRGKRDQIWVVRNSNLQASGERAVRLKRRNGVLDSSITRNDYLSFTAVIIALTTHFCLLILLFWPIQPFIILSSLQPSLKSENELF